MSTVRVRRLDENYEPVQGQGKADFITDLDAAAQILRQRLLLFTGEWWEDTKEGLPMFQSILGGAGSGRKKQAVDSLIQRRILSSPYVTGIERISSTYTPDTRAYTFQASVNTQFGIIIVSNT